MSIDAYEDSNERFELYSLLNEGLNDVPKCNTKAFSESLSKI